MTNALRRRAPLRAAALVAAVLVAACSGRASSSDEALRRDLNAAGGDGLALAPRGSQTQVVSALELANGGKVAPTGVPARTAAPTPPAAPPPVATPRELPPRIITRIRYVDRAPAPAAEVATAPAPAPAPQPAPVASAPSPEPAPVGAPSPGSRRYPDPVDGRSRHDRQRHPWDMGDVIRNAPFPINP